MSALVDRRLERSAIALSLMIGGALVPACKKADSNMNAPTAADSTTEEAGGQDPLVQLEQLEGRMRELGLTTAPAREKQADAAIDQAHGVPSEPQAAPTEAAVQRDDLSPPPAAESRCTTVCALNEAICELEVQICSMAKNHDSDPVYSDACERAVDDCELSGDACDTCVE